MRKVLRVAPAGPPITLAQVKELSFNKSTTRDAELQNFIDAAVDNVEARTGRALITQQFDIIFDRFEFFRDLTVNDAVYLSTLNINSIESMVTIASDGTETTISASDYRLSEDRIVFDNTKPTSNTRQIDAVRIAVTAGYAATEATIDQDIKVAITMLAVHYLDNGVLASTDDYKKMVDALDALLMKYRSTVSWFH